MKKLIKIVRLIFIKKLAIGIKYKPALSTISWAFACTEPASFSAIHWYTPWSLRTKPRIRKWVPSIWKKLKHRPLSLKIAKLQFLIKIAKTIYHEIFATNYCFTIFKPANRWTWLTRCFTIKLKIYKIK